MAPAKDGRWELRRPPHDVIGRFPLKSQAIAQGQKVARGHDFAQLLVYQLDQTIEQEWTHLVEKAPTSPGDADISATTG